jgi:hypothetical protein
VESSSGSGTIARCWMLPIRYLPYLLERVEKDLRNVVIENHAGHDAAAGDA